MVDALYLHLSGALLFGLVFLFLWRQSGVVYFGYWSLAWAVEAAAWLCTWLAQNGAPRWLAAHSLLEFAFALSLVAAARAGSDRVATAWRSALRLLLFFPAFLLVLELIGWNHHNWYQVLRSLVLAAIYWFSFRQLSFGTRRLFHFTLLGLCLLYLLNAVSYLIVIDAGGMRPAGMAYLDYLDFYDLALKTLLAFSAMAMWIESQSDRVTQIGRDLDRVRREVTRDTDLDYLTGLLNQSSLQRRLDSDEVFNGVAAVFDLDGFKSINDRFGHLVGDEVLRNIGNLLRSSVRVEDQAYRWGGDEFTVLFQDQAARLARSRMREIEARLHDFRIRGHGALRIQLSWGVSEGAGARLREVLERADQEMYKTKREKQPRSPGAPAASV